MTIKEIIDGNQLPEGVKTGGITPGHILPAPQPKIPVAKKSESGKD